MGLVIADGPTTGTMQGTRNAQGGIDYVIEVDPINLGAEASQVTGG